MPSVKLGPIRRRSTVEEVADRIREVIESRQLPPGARLPGELDLVEQLQVSRPVLREALSRLQSLGLVEIRRGRGTFVGDRNSLTHCAQLVQTAITVSPRELLTYAELRTAIEVQAVRQAAERATSAQLAELDALLVALDEVERPYVEHLDLDFRFHKKLVEASGNPLMQNLMEVLCEFVIAQMAQTTPTPVDNELGRTLHRQIVSAVRQRDADAAERAMRQHMNAVLERLTRLTEPTHA